jgi:hypothetical protein
MGCDHRAVDGGVVLTALKRFQALGRLKSGAMNRTEREYSQMLEMRKHAGEIVWYAFEPFKIRLADRTFYDVDFAVMLATGHLEVHEVKGGFITDDGRVKLKVAAELFPAQFWMCQKVAKAWHIEMVGRT